MPLKPEETIQKFPNFFQKGLKKSLNLPFANESFEGALICGMGGSALAAQFLKPFFPLQIHRNYNLPSHVKNNHIVICISYSGNTEETLSAYQSAKKKGLPLMVITSGGKLEKLAKQDNVPVARIETKGIEPRMSVTEQMGLLINILTNINLSSLTSLKTDIALKIDNPKKDAKSLSNELINQVPLIYTSNRNKAIGYYFKALFNENVKVPAFSNTFPELNHNELMQGKGIDWTNKFHVLMIKDAQDLPKLKKRMQLTAQLLKEKGFSVTSLPLKGETPLEKILYSISFSNWLTIFLAKKINIDPIDADVRERFKEKIAREN